jgi:hypothetical protein
MNENRPSPPEDSNVFVRAVRKFAAIVLVATAFATVFYMGKRHARAKVDRFAQCVTGKGAVMYGLFWCPHCEEQKEIFGASFREIRYVECGTADHHETPQCSTAGLKDFPTWTFGDGQQEAGAMSLQELAAKTGCPLQ